MTACLWLVFALLPLANGADFIFKRHCSSPGCTATVATIDSPNGDHPALQDTCIAYSLGAGAGRDYWRKWSCNATHVVATCYKDYWCTDKKVDCDAAFEASLGCAGGNSDCFAYSCGNSYDAAFFKNYMYPPSTPCCSCEEEHHVIDSAVPLGACYLDPSSGGHSRKNECVDGNLVVTRYAGAECSGAGADVAKVEATCTEPGPAYAARTVLVSGCAPAPTKGDKEGSSTAGLNDATAEPKKEEHNLSWYGSLFMLALVVSGPLFCLIALIFETGSQDQQVTKDSLRACRQSPMKNSHSYPTSRRASASSTTSTMSEKSRSASKGSVRFRDDTL